MTAASLFRLSLISLILAGLLVKGVVFADPFDEKMSMDTTRIDITVNGDRFLIPRNYLVEMSDWSGGNQKDGVSLRVVYPGLNPYSAETADCMSRKIKCRIYDVHFSPTGDFSSERGIENIIKLSEHPAGRQGPYGFWMYEVGEKKHRIDFFQKEISGNKIVFDCQLYDIEGKNGGVCHHFSHTKTGRVSLSYFFEMNDGLKDAVEVDRAITDLVNNFSAEGGGK